MMWLFNKKPCKYARYSTNELLVLQKQLFENVRFWIGYGRWSIPHQKELDMVNAELEKRDNKGVVLAFDKEKMATK